MKISITLLYILVSAFSPGGPQASVVPLDAGTAQYRFDGSEVGAFAYGVTAPTGEAAKNFPGAAGFSDVDSDPPRETLAYARWGDIGNDASRQVVVEDWGADFLAGTGVLGPFQSEDNLLVPVRAAPGGAPWYPTGNAGVVIPGSSDASPSNRWLALGVATETPTNGERLLATRMAQVPLSSSFYLLGVAAMAVILIAPRSSRDSPRR